MSKLLTCLFLCSLACTDPINLTICGTPCFTGSPDKANVGLCKPGYIECTKTGTVCVGQVLPEKDKCDGKDNDCDGKIDEGFLSSHCGEDQGECKPGLSKCVKGQVVCEGAIPPTLEILDCKDNDCDGRTDEDLVEFCYEGPDGTLMNGPCRPGYKKCLNGSMICEKQILPKQSDVCGNEIDDDCNGAVDDTDGSEPQYIAVLWIFDRSGSMSPYIGNVQFAATAFAETSSTSNLYKYYVFNLPGSSTTSTASPHVVCHPESPPVAACDTQAFVNTINTLSRVYGGQEPIYDVLFDIAKGRLDIQWPDNASRYIVFFGDEAGQSQRNLTERDVTDALGKTDIVFYGFVTFPFQTHYDHIANINGGRLYDLTRGSLDFLEQFEDSFVPLCE